MEIIYKDEAFAVQGACFEVYKTLGNGFLEAVYQEALAHEFKLQGIQFQEQCELKFQYKGIQLKQSYKPDFICYDKIIVEIKAVSNLSPEHRAQLLNYLKITNMHLGLLVNFGHYPKIEIERIVL
ncbi:MAG: GxxExxY protein [Kiritimatiellae bacterium]|nr:GxxExxY protein [Kiritimatiellia bacterium]